MSKAHFYGRIEHSNVDNVINIGDFHMYMLSHVAFQMFYMEQLKDSNEYWIHISPGFELKYGQAITKIT